MEINSFGTREIRLSTVFVVNGLANEGQRGFYREYIQRILAGGTEGDLLHVCLREMARNYDAAGLSAGRSVFSLLLDKTWQYLDKNDLGAARRVFSMLASIHFNPEYLARYWGKDRVTDVFPYGSLTDVVLVTAAGLELGIDAVSVVNLGHGDDLLSRRR